MAFNISIEEGIIVDWEKSGLDILKMYLLRDNFNFNNTRPHEAAENLLENIMDKEDFLEQNQLQETKQNASVFYDTVLAQLKQLEGLKIAELLKEYSREIDFDAEIEDGKIILNEFITFTPSLEIGQLSEYAISNEVSMGEYSAEMESLTLGREDETPSLKVRDVIRSKLESILTKLLKKKGAEKIRERVFLIKFNTLDIVKEIIDNASLEGNPPQEMIIDFEEFPRMKFNSLEQAIEDDFVKELIDYLMARTNVFNLRNAYDVEINLEMGKNNTISGSSSYATITNNGNIRYTRNPMRESRLERLPAAFTSEDSNYTIKFEELAEEASKKYDKEIEELESKIEEKEKQLDATEDSDAQKRIQIDIADLKRKMTDKENDKKENIENAISLSLSKDNELRRLREELFDFYLGINENYTELKQILERNV